MQPQSEQQQDTGKYKIQVLKKMKTSINMDCIKNCPMDRSVWALAFYQHNPQFLGGIMVINSHNLMLLDNIDSTNHALLCTYNGSQQAINNKNSISLTIIKNIIYQLLQDAIKPQSVATPQNNLLQPFKNEFYYKKVHSVFIAIGNHLQKPLNIRLQHLQLSALANLVYSVLQSKQRIYEYKKHQYAVWACRINPDISVRSLMIVGDEVDCLYLYDLTKKQLIGKNKKAHTQGICEITWKDNKNILTGSFDGSFAEISIDNFGEILRRFQLGGTIWRIIPIKQKSKQVNSMLICNSSQKKFQIYNTKNKTITWDSDTEHTSLAYAADHNGQIIITASFYDQSVRIWKIYPHST